MGSIEAIVSNLEYGRSQIFEATEGLSKRELTEIPIYEGWTIKEVLAHLIGWDQWAVNVLSLIVQDRADEIAAVDRDARNQTFVSQWHDRSLAEILNAVRVSHQQVTDFIRALDHVEMDTRRERGGRTITIRSYVIDLTVEHERRHAVEINHWREALAETIDPAGIKRALAGQRAEFMAALAGLSEADLMDQTAIGSWSVKDMVGHVADWEILMLLAAQHIYDPSRAPVTPISALEGIEAWNEVLANNRSGQPWEQVLQSLRETQAGVDDFVQRLTRGDWKLRGPFPWPDDQGTLAELISHIASHYTDHIPALIAWRDRRRP